jgi:hypothetical protein
MERRFRHHGLDRATMVPAIEFKAPRNDSDEWKAMAGRHAAASHVECMRRVLEEVPESEGGAIICEDDVLIHNDFAERLEPALANLPDEAGMLLLGFMVVGWPEGLVWSGNDPECENLVPVIPWVSWGAHGYWVKHAYARERVEALGDVPVEELSENVESQITFPAHAHAAYPPLMLQETVDSVVRPAREVANHVQMQAAWPYSDYAAAEPEPPISPLAKLPGAYRLPLLEELIDARYATSEIEGVSLGVVALSDGTSLSLEEDRVGRCRLVRRDAEGTIAEMSPAFRFSDRPVERAVGVAWAGSLLLLGFQVDGREHGLAACELDDALGLLRPPEA